MPYEPARPTRPAKSDSPESTRTRPIPARFAAFAALFFLFLALFNLVMTPQGVPPEFPLFLALAAIAGAVWWAARPGNSKRRPSGER